MARRDTKMAHIEQNSTEIPFLNHGLGIGNSQAYIGWFGKRLEFQFWWSGNHGSRRKSKAHGVKGFIQHWILHTMLAMVFVALPWIVLAKLSILGVILAILRKMASKG